MPTDNGPPRGTRDLLPDVVAKRETVIAELAASYARFGFRRIETPALEDISRLSWGEGGDNEKLSYRILRRGLGPVVAEGTELSELTDLGLRYDLTVPLTRFYANNAGKLASPFRAMQIGPVWRAERPQKGRYRQFTQCDIDTIGEPTVLAECELLEATLAALQAIGIAPVRLRVNDRRLLAAIAAEAGVPADLIGSFLVTLDKLDKIGWDGVKAELSERGYPEAVGARCEWVVGVLTSDDSPAVVLDRAADLLPGVPDTVLSDLRSTFEALEQMAADAGATVGPIATWSLDPTIVRGMGYYSGQIFEFGHPDSPSSIAGGGRYDGLVGRSLGRDVPACGVSIGFDRVVDMASFDKPDLGIAVVYSDRSMADVLATARRLRAAQPGRPAALVARRGQLKLQLDSLKQEGYSAFVVVDGTSVSDERPLRD
ncbi:MAG TPA: ATP phosphoribosyltransferase regulatory subunit [Acidimicrobiales bacterium]|nr:ATP phosphoribosyltransferase regulatory subunit [Acidimicrobiales bacterium]